MTLDAPTLFITGGGVGMGRKIALSFANQGYRVAVTGIEGQEETAGELGIWAATPWLSPLT